MSYEVITDFRGGLDARKYQLSLPPGTLTGLVNGHITSGAEIEKRMAFCKLGSYPAGSFGLQATPTGFLVFGSADQTGNTFPTGFTYQQLQHPAVLNGTTYDSSKHAMADVLHSDIFNGMAFVLAIFADGYTFAYFNGQLVDDFTNGLVLPYIYNGGTGTDINLAKELVKEVNGTVGYSATQGVSPNASQFDTFSLPGNRYALGVFISGVSNITVTTGSDTAFSTAIVAATDGTNAGDGSSVTIGGVDYTFKNTVANPSDVHIGSNMVATMKNLYNAINFSGTVNVDYKGSAANANVIASDLNLTSLPTFSLTARAVNTLNGTSNSIAGVVYSQAEDTIPKITGIVATGQFDVSLIQQEFANATLSLSTGSPAVPTNGSSITIGGVTYTFVTASTPPTLAYQIYIGTAGITLAKAQATMDSLIAAINGTGVIGTDVGAATPQNPSVNAAGREGSSFVITARTAGTAGNAIAISKSGTIGYTTLPATLSGAGDSGFSSIKVGPVLGSGSLASNGSNPVDGSAVTIGSKTYTFKSAANFHTPFTEGWVKIGNTPISTMQNLIMAVNLTGVNDFNYHVGVLNPSAVALATPTNNTIQFIARNPGAVVIPLSASSSPAANLTPSGANFAGGANTVELLAASITSLLLEDEVSFAANVAAAITLNSAVSGFTAESIKNTVYITTTSANSFANNADITTTAIGNCAVDFFGWQFNTQFLYNSSFYSMAILLDGLMCGSSVLGQGYSLSSVVAVLAGGFNGSSINGGLFIAIFEGNQLYFSRKVCTSSAFLASIGYYIATGNIITIEGISKDGLVATATPPSIYFQRQQIASRDPQAGLSAFNSFVNSGGGHDTPVYLVANACSVIASCKAVGGYAPYKYKWQYVSGDQSFMVSDATQPNVNFSRNPTGQPASANWNCIVTDATGVSAATNSILLIQP